MIVFVYGVRSVHCSFSICDECELSSSDATAIRGLPRLRESPEVHCSRSPTVRKVEVPIARVPIFSTLLFATFDSRKRRENDRISLSRVHYARSYELVLNSHERCRNIGVALPLLRCEKKSDSVISQYRIFAQGFASFVILICDTFALDLSSISQAKFGSLASLAR